MLKFACKDVGVDCAFIATGNSIEDVKVNGQVALGALNDGVPMGTVFLPLVVR